MDFEDVVRNYAVFKLWALSPSRRKNTMMRVDEVFEITYGNSLSFRACLRVEIRKVSDSFPENDGTTGLPLTLGRYLVLSRTKRVS